MAMVVRTSTLRPIFFLVEIAYGQEVHAVQRRGEEQPDQDQAHGGTERIGDNAMQPFLQEGGGDAEYRLGAEPSGEHRGGHHIERQVTPGDGKIPRIVYARGGIQADADRNDPVGDDKPQQHMRVLELSDDDYFISDPENNRQPQPQVSDVRHARS